MRQLFGLANLFWTIATPPLCYQFLDTWVASANLEIPHNFRRLVKMRQLRLQNSRCVFFCNEITHVFLQGKRNIHNTHHKLVSLISFFIISVYLNLFKSWRTVDCDFVLLTELFKRLDIRLVRREVSVLHHLVHHRVTNVWYSSSRDRGHVDISSVCKR